MKTMTRFLGIAIIIMSIISCNSTTKKSEYVKVDKDRNPLVFGGQGIGGLGKWVHG